MVLAAGLALRAIKIHGGGTWGKGRRGGDKETVEAGGWRRHRRAAGSWPPTVVSGLAVEGWRLGVAGSQGKRTGEGEKENREIGRAHV